MITKYKKHHRIIATVFLLIFFPTLVPNNLFASNNGPVAPEATSFEPVDATDMVNLVTGDMSYVLPMLNIPSPEGGFPLGLSNHSGIAMDQEASWVGLGWSLNPGAINRSVNGYPDDWTKTQVTDFFYDQGAVEDRFTFSIGGTFPNGLTLGLGASWGSNRAFGGTVTLGVGYGALSVTGGNDGIWGFNVNGFGVGSSGVSLGVSGGISNTASGSLGYNFSNNEVSVGIASKLVAGKQASVGMNFRTNGSSSSLTSSAGRGSSNETSRSGNVDLKVVNDNIGIDLGAYWFGYGHTTITYFLHDINVNTVSGSLYPYHYKKDEEVVVYKPQSNGDPAPYIHSTLRSGYKSDSRIDSGAEFRIVDPYNASSGPYMEDTYNNFSPCTVDYDNYYVTAPGLSGNLAPYISEERLLSPSSQYYDNPSIDNSFDLNQKTNFYFKDLNSSFFRINEGAFNFDGTQSLNSFNSIIESLNHGSFYGFRRDGNSYSKVVTPAGDAIRQGNKMRAGNNIEVFTNNDINSGNVFGFIEAKGINRKTDEIFTDEPLGIGAYRITTIDGKTYHYSLPVYQYETYSKRFKDSNDENKNFLEVKKERKYATHWLLTAITGSDYYDVNQNGKVDAGDYGYWVEFEYGKWSDGYAWRSPHSGYKGIPDREGNTVSYSYYWGRKQIYYLDAIKTRTHTALFVKKLRKDDNSTFFNEYTSKINSVSEFDRSLKCKQYGSQQFNNPIKREGDYFLSNGNPFVISNDVTNLKGRQTSFMYVDIPKNYSLCLDKILLLKNEDTINVNKKIGNLINNSTGYMYSGLGYTNVKYSLGIPLPDLFTNIAVVKTFQVNLHQNVLDISDVDYSQLEARSLKTIRFDYNYDLGKNSDNSEDINKGRLTLKSINFLGKQGIQVLPPYVFDYFGANVNFNKDTKDNWGYNKTNPESWSLKSIITPTGANIIIDYEADSYRREAISSFANNGYYYTEYPFKYVKASKPDFVKFQMENITSVVKEGNNITINFSPNLYPANFEELFKSLYVGSEVYLQYNTGNKMYRDVYQIKNFSQNDNPSFYHKESISVTLRTIDETQSHDHFVDQFYPSNATDADYLNNNKLTLLKLELPRDVGTEGTGDLGGVYTIHANDNGISGGGLRVKSISIKNVSSASIDEINEYSYINPFSKKISGITSYAPFDVYKFVPVVALLPSPGVMYEYVTVVKKNRFGDKFASRLYEFNVLRPNNILVNGDYSKNFENIRFGKYLKIGKGTSKTIVYDPSLPTHKVWDIYSTVKDRLSALGALRSITEFNSVDQIIGKQKYNYKESLDSDGQIGVKENSYYSFNHDQSYAGGSTVKIISTNIIEYPNIIENISTSKMGSENVIFHDKYNFLTGELLETSSVFNNGQSFKTKTIPAYYKYPEMGSKVDNINNKNMLSQAAANYSYILDKASNKWKETGVGITTWSNIWGYKDIAGNTVSVLAAAAPNEKIWRKHKTYVWNGLKDGEGIFSNYDRISGSRDDKFVWTVGVGSQPAQWKQTSEVTLYDHYSAPLEMKDINGNLASTKMGDNDTKVMATGNAGYSEMFYAGAENLTQNTTWLEPEITMTNALRNPTYFHTGKYSVGATSSSLFGVSMKNLEHRPGKYKVSVWVEKTNAAKATLKVNGGSVNFLSDDILAGNWQLKTAYITVPAGVCSVYLNSVDTSTVYFDDLMIRPIASSITGYVYNEWDELTHIIGNNGLATRFEYDAAGRLVKTYTEVIDDVSSGEIGGFKVVKTNTYNNKYL
jgi:YD repeat-containing protein